MITLYHQDGCGQCRMAEILLKQEKIEFEGCKDIEVMQAKGITRTPTLDTGTELIFGAKAIKEWLETREK